MNLNSSWIDLVSVNNTILLAMNFEMNIHRRNLSAADFEKTKQTPPPTFLHKINSHCGDVDKKSTHKYFTRCVVSKAMCKSV